MLFHKNPNTSARFTCRVRPRLWPKANYYRSNLLEQLSPKRLAGAVESTPAQLSFLGWSNSYEFFIKQ
jgi:hypothetical protein